MLTSVKLFTNSSYLIQMSFLGHNSRVNPQNQRIDLHNRICAIHADLRRPALTSEEMDTGSITLPVIGDDVFSFRNGYTLCAFQKNCDTFCIIYTVGMCVVLSQSGRVIFTETDNGS